MPATSRVKGLGALRLPLRWSLPLGAEAVLALATAYGMYSLSGHVYCDRATQDSRLWLAAGILLSLPLTWLLAGRTGRGARPAMWALIVVRLLLAAFVFLLLQPFSGEWYMEC
ncbi:hypothetical protein ACQEWB_18265 [Streptomyces sp. CA-249302]|uniref:hypothetical protein n=1 Tax=Streptomyces sp. CA-249302 TaxID=3240058 RepID=UPI003D8AE88D